MDIRNCEHNRGHTHQQSVSHLQNYVGAHTTSVFTIGTHITSLAYNLQSNTTTTNTSVVHVDDIAKVTSPPPTDTPTTKITFASFDSSTYNISGGWANFDTTDKNTIVS